MSEIIKEVVITWKDDDLFYIRQNKNGDIEFVSNKVDVDEFSPETRASFIEHMKDFFNPHSKEVDK